MSRVRIPSRPPNHIVLRCGRCVHYKADKYSRDAWCLIKKEIVRYWNRCHYTWPMFESRFVYIKENYHMPKGLFTGHGMDQYNCAYCGGIVYRSPNHKWEKAYCNNDCVGKDREKFTDEDTKEEYEKYLRKEIGVTEIAEYFGVDRQSIYTRFKKLKLRVDGRRAIR